VNEQYGRGTTTASILLTYSAHLTHLWSNYDSTKTR